jgi:hypothetical protein
MRTEELPGMVTAIHQTDEPQQKLNWFEPPPPEGLGDGEAEAAGALGDGEADTPALGDADTETAALGEAEADTAGVEPPDTHTWPLALAVNFVGAGTTLASSVSLLCSGVVQSFCCGMPHTAHTTRHAINDTTTREGEVR